MKIGEVSKELGIPSATLRYYEQIGLLEDVKKEHGIREYQDCLLYTSPSPRDA